MQGVHGSQFPSASSGQAKLTVTSLTMTIRKPVLSQSKEGAQRSMQTTSPPFE